MAGALLGLARSSVRQADGVLLLIAALSLPSWPPWLWTLLVAYAVFSLLGRSNAAFTFRSAGGGGILFAVCMGPMLVMAYDGPEAMWSGTDISADLLAVGSLQALVDFAFCMAPAVHGAQLVFFTCAGTAYAQLPAAWLATFLVVQKVTLCWCFEKKRWGRCFSPPEGLFWAQAFAMACTCLRQGYSRGFLGWSSTGLFCSTLAAFGALFLLLTAAAYTAVRQHAPFCAAAACLLLFLAWACTNTRGWEQEVPLLWFTRLLSSHPTLLLLQWPLLLIGGITAVDHFPEARGSRLRLILRRKAFHALAVALFVPPLLQGHSEFLGLALLVAALLFVALEACRACQAPWLGHRLDAFTGSYLDARENGGGLVLTHLYLLLGCALPVWLERGHHRGPAPAMLWQASGICLVGVGDACAAAVGVAWGRLRWPLSHRTLEGSLAFVGGSLLGAACILFLDGGVVADVWGRHFAAATALSALLEVYTESIDNLVLPLFFCTTLRLLAGSWIQQTEQQ